MVPWDVRLQYRYGFYGVYAVLTVLFAATLRSVPSGAARETALLLVVFSDPSFLGFYFVAVTRFDSINAFYIGLAPVLMGAVMRYFVPFATESLRGVLDLAAYYPEVAGALLLFGPAIIGFAVGFLMFEDREQGTVVALTLTPLGGGGYLAYRLLVTLALSLGAALVVVPPSGLVTVRPLALVAAAGGSRPADGQRRRTVDEHALGRFDGASLHGETVEPLEERRYRDGRLQSGE
jgi:hypothetical protein